MKGKYKLCDILIVISNYDDLDDSNKDSLLINALSDSVLLDQIMKNNSQSDYIKDFQYSLLNDDHFVSKNELEYSDNSIN